MRSPQSSQRPGFNEHLISTMVVFRPLSVHGEVELSLLKCHIAGSRAIYRTDRLRTRIPVFSLLNNGATYVF